MRLNLAVSVLTLMAAAAAFAFAFLLWLEIRDAGPEPVPAPAIVEPAPANPGRGEISMELVERIAGMSAKRKLLGGPVFSAWDLAGCDGYFAGLSIPSDVDE